jgi:hypothetical protein
LQIERGYPSLRAFAASRESSRGLQDIARRRERAELRPSTIFPKGDGVPCIPIKLPSVGHRIEYFGMQQSDCAGLVETFDNRVGLRAKEPTIMLDRAFFTAGGIDALPQENCWMNRRKEVAREKLKGGRPQDFFPLEWLIGST